MNNASPPNKLMVIAIVVVLAMLAYVFLTTPDRRNGAEKLGDAIHELPKGPDKALRQLENRTPGEKLGDAVKDTGDDIERNTSHP